MNAVGDFLARAAEQCGFERNSYVEKNMPTSFENIVVIPFFGDMKSTFIMSTFLLNRYKEVTNKYVILCSWDGHQGLYPHVDEFWYPKDRSSLSDITSHAEYMHNSSDTVVQFERSLNKRFDHILCSEDLQKLYNQGFESEFWSTFDNVHRFFPSILSTSKNDVNFVNDFNRHQGDKVVIFPSKKVRTWHRGKTILAPSPKDFWITLVDKLLENNITPVIYQNEFTYNLSQEFADRCIYLVSKNIIEVLSCMRQVGCVIDLYSGISRYAILARCPFICVDERVRFMEDKEYEIDDLCCQNIPKKYIFSFSSFILSGDVNHWCNSIIDNIVIKIKELLPTFNSQEWESTAESNAVLSYQDCVREKHTKRIGMKFIRKY